MQWSATKDVKIKNRMETYNLYDHSPGFVALSSSIHAIKEFDCLEISLNTFLQQYAGQGHKNYTSRTYCIVDESIQGSKKKIIAYYSLASGSILINEMSLEHKKILSAYINPLPVIVVGRLAVDKFYRGQGYGEIALMDALERTLDLSNKIGACAVVVDALNDVAIKFYQKYGFIHLQENRYFIPMKEIKKLFT